MCGRFPFDEDDSLLGEPLPNESSLFPNQPDPPSEPSLERLRSARKDDAARETGEVSARRWAKERLARPVMKMTQAVHTAIVNDLAAPRFQREQGGILLGPHDAQDLVVKYVKDENGQATAASFTIDHDGLNYVIRRVRPAGLTCVGLVHSHPDGICRPSGGDLAFLEQIFSSPKNSGGPGYFLFPIVCNERIYPFVIDTNDVGRILVAELILV